MFISIWVGVFFLFMKFANSLLPLLTWGYKCLKNMNIQPFPCFFYFWLTLVLWRVAQWLLHVLHIKTVIRVICLVRKVKWYAPAHHYWQIFQQRIDMAKQIMICNISSFLSIFVTWIRKIFLAIKSTSQVLTWIKNVNF